MSNMSVFPKGERLSEKQQQNFVGQAYLKKLPGSGILISNVTFEAGCRNNWHIHHGAGQTLLVTGGEGWYQEDGSPKRRLRAGDVVVISPGVKHWHGATKDSRFCHLAIKPDIEGAYCEWLDAVDEETYISETSI